MSIALESNSGNGIERSGFVHGMGFSPIYDSPEARRGILAGGSAKNKVVELKDELESSSSSSIGRNSDSSGREGPDGDGDSGEGEVQSSFKGSLDTMEALEEVLPIKRGISKFYCGKSKSFTSLADASSCSTIKDIVKSENAYTRKRKNLLAHNIFFDKNHISPLRNSSGGMSKRAAKSNRSTSNLAATASSFECNNKSELSSSNSLSPTPCLPPLYPHGRRPPTNNESLSSLSPPQRTFSSWRSFSLSDLQCAAAASPNIPGLVVSNEDKESKLH